MPPLIRLQPIVAALLLAAWFEVLRVRPSWVILLSLLLVVLIVGTMFTLFTGDLFTMAFLGFTSVPLVLLGSGMFFYLFLDDLLLHRVVSIGVAFLVWFYYDNVYTFLHRVQSYQPFALQNIANYILLVSSFFFAAGLFGIRVFLQTPLALLVAVFAVGTALMITIQYWTYKVPVRTSLLYSAGVVLMLVELFLVIYYLPTGYEVNGALVAVFFYVLSNLTRLHLIGALKPSGVRRYMIIGASMVVLVLLTAQWT